MKIRNLFRAFLLASLFSGVAFSAASCVDEKGGDEPSTKYAAVCGVVKDTYGNLLEDVDVIVRTTDSSKEVVASTKSNYDGTFAIAVVPSNAGFVSFEKAGFSSVGITISKDKFENGAVFLSPILEFAQASISGRVLNAMDGNAPFEGVSVSIGSKNTTTGADGCYKFENLTLKEYELTITKAGCATVTKTIKLSDFNEAGEVLVEDVILGGKEILRGLSAQDLRDTPKWHLNEYRGGYGNGGGEKDWSTTFMSAQFQRWYGGWEMQNEGCTLRFRNEPTKDGDVDMVNFDTFTYGSKLITADNKIMSVNVRCHQASNENPAYWGVQVIDLSAAEPEAVLVGGIQTHPSGDYASYYFDLGDYVGKEVIIAIGRFVHHVGEWNQLCISHVSFASGNVVRDAFLETAGEGVEEVVAGWHMTKEEVRSIMPNAKTHFIAYTPSGVNVQTKSNPAYKNWATVDHICSEWGFQYVNKDTEPMAGEGFVFKTRSDIDPDYVVPASYFYSKFSIKAGHNKMVIHMRNFDSSVPTTFCVTAIQTDGTVNYLAPDTTASVVDQLSAVAGTNCWQFIHEKGGVDVPNEYGVFVYDLSSFNGEDVVFTLGVHKGDNRGGEQKICLHSIDIE